jgi:hypothetical protein
MDPLEEKPLATDLAKVGRTIAWFKRGFEHCGNKDKLLRRLFVDQDHDEGEGSKTA